MRRDAIIGQQRVIGLLTFLAAPFILLAMPGDVLMSFLLGTALGITLVFADRFRTVGIGLLVGTVTTFGLLVVLGEMLASVD